MLRVEFRTPLAGISATVFESEISVQSLEIDNALPVAGDSVFLFVTVRFEGDISSDEVSDALSELWPVEVHTTRADDDTCFLALVTGLSQASMLSLLTKNKAIPHRIVGHDQSVQVTASVRDWNHLKTVAGAIEAEHGSLELVGTTQTDGIGFPLGADKLKQSVSGKLSDEQLVVLETAYRMGYFEVPRSVTASELAGKLEISRSTLSERLRRVENNLCGLLFGPRR